MLIQFIVGTVYADDADAPGCFAPPRPDFRDAYDYSDYRQEIENYHRCIDRYINAQQLSAREHLDAALKAREEWDKFESELN